MIIHINGQPGVGKYTVAKHLAKKLNARLIDNHSILNTAMVCADHGTPEYIRIAMELVEYVYAELVKRPEDEVMIFTNCLVEQFENDKKRYGAVKDLAVKREVAHIPIQLACDLEENMQRIQSEERAAKKKLMDPEVLKSSRAHHTFIHPESDPLALRLDNTNLTAEQTAEKIYQHVMDVKASK